MITIESIRACVEGVSSPEQMLTRLGGLIHAHDQKLGITLMRLSAEATVNKVDADSLRRLLNSTAYGGPNAQS